MRNKEKQTGLRKVLSDVFYSDFMTILIGLSVVFTILYFIGSCVDSLTQYTVKTKVEITYESGEKEVLTISKSKNVSGEPILYNGCVYKRKAIGSTMWSEDSYIGCLRCGVKYFKVISRKIEENEKN